MTRVAFYRSDRPTRAVDTVIAYTSHYHVLIGGIARGIRISYRKPSSASTGK